MKRIVRITENDLVRIVKRVIMEQKPDTSMSTQPEPTDNEIAIYANAIDGTVKKFMEMNNLNKYSLNHVKGEYVKQLDDFFKVNGFPKGYSNANNTDWKNYSTIYNNLNQSQKWINTKMLVQ